jgi:hypothetical protein
MTKSETNETTRAIKFSEAGLGVDYLARALSSLYRSARTTKSQNEILALAVAYRATSSKEFII